MQKHVFISGRVQGVGYRAWTSATARKLGLSGWVRNLRDGRVEALFDGPDDVVQQMLKACEKGPFAAKVRGMEVLDSAEDCPDGFLTRDTD